MQLLVANLRNSGYWHFRHACRFLLLPFFSRAVVVVGCVWVCPLLFLLSSNYAWYFRVGRRRISPTLSLSSVLVVTILLLLLRSLPLSLAFLPSQIVFVGCVSIILIIVPPLQSDNHGAGGPFTPWGTWEVSCNIYSTGVFHGMTTAHSTKSRKDLATIAYCASITRVKVPQCWEPLGTSKAPWLESCFACKSSPKWSYCI